MSSGLLNFLNADAPRTPGLEGARPTAREADTPMPLDSLTASEQDALRRVGLAQDPQATRQDAERARRDSEFVHFCLYDTALTVDAVADMLGVAASSITRRVQERSLVALCDRGGVRLPALQFHDRKVLPGLEVVLAALPLDLKPIEVLSWLVSPTTELEDSEGRPQSPRDCLLNHGDTATVIAVARAFSRSASA